MSDVQETLVCGLRHLGLELTVCTSVAMSEKLPGASIVLCEQVAPESCSVSQLFSSLSYAPFHRATRTTS